MTTCDQTKPKVARVVCSSQSEAGQTNMNRNTGGLLGCGPGELVHSRDKLYRLIISQLFYDGYQQVAVTLTNMVHADPPCPPSDRLSHVVTLGMDKETEPGHRNLNKSEQELGPGLDLEYETEMTSSAPEPATYETAYVTSHKGNCRSGAFSADGQLCATGSVDASIKILDVDRMLAKSNPEGRGGMDQTGHPVIRTLYDHLEVRDQISVSVLLFKHLLVSGGDSARVPPQGADPRLRLSGLHSQVVRLQQSLGQKSIQDHHRRGAHNLHVFPSHWGLSR